MAAPVYLMNFEQDIAFPITIRHGGMILFTGDNLADTVSVSIFENGAAHAISGTVTMNCIRADGATVAVTGSVSGNTASATLTQACVAIPGPLAVVMKITSDSTTTTLLKVIYTVDIGVTGTAVDPGTIIPDINALISAVETAIGSIPADYSDLLAAIAPSFNPEASTPYPAGSYVWYPGLSNNPGALYRFTAAHSGSWTGSDVEVVVFGNEIANLKNAYNTDMFLYETLASGNKIDITPYTGETIDKAVSAISVSTAATTFDLLCCGKNHMQPKVNSGGVNGFTWESKADGTIVLNGTTDRDYNLSFGSDIGRILNVYNTKWRSSIQKSAENDAVQIKFNGVLQGDYCEFDAHTTAYAWSNYLFIPTGTTCDNLVVYPMVEFGNYETTISYEAFSGFIKSYTYDSAVTSGTIDWGSLDIPENATTLWMYATTNTTTIYDKKSALEVAQETAEQVDSLADDIDGAYAHAWSKIVDGWSDEAVTYSADGFINSGGTVTSNGNFRNSDFVSCNPGNKIDYNLYGYSTQVYLVTFYNALKERISGVVGQSSYKSGTEIAPQNTAYVRFSSSVFNTGEFTISTRERVSGDDTVDQLKSYSNSLVSVTSENAVLTRGDVDVITGKIYTASQGIYSLEAGRMTDYIPVSAGDTVKYRLYTYIGTSVQQNAITVFDANKGKIASVRAEETGWLSGTYTIPENGAYIIISWEFGMLYDGWFEITVANYTQKLADIVEIQGRIPSSNLKGKQWCCLGDSITFGANTTNTYLKYIGERCAITAYNFGVSNTAIAKSSSSVTNNMATRYANMYDDVDYITVFGGTNDHGQGISIGQWGDTEQTTLYGAMKVLCDGLTAKYVGKKIGFILPLPKYTATGGVYTDYSYPNSSFMPYIECIHDVCKRYSIPVLDMYLESGLTVGNSDVRTELIPDGLHPNAKGHEFISWKIQRFLERL